MLSLYLDTQVFIIEGKSFAVGNANNIILGRLCLFGIYQTQVSGPFNPVLSNPSANSGYPQILHPCLTTYLSDLKQCLHIDIAFVFFVLLPYVIVSLLEFDHTQTCSFFMCPNIRLFYQADLVTMNTT